MLSSKRAGRAGGINWVFLSDSSVAGARQMLRRCTCMYCSVASLFRGFRPGAYRSRVLNAEMELKRRSGRSIAAKAVE